MPLAVLFAIFSDSAAKIHARFAVLSQEIALPSDRRPIGLMVMTSEAIGSYHDTVRGDALAMLSGHAGRVLDFGGGVGATSVTLKNTGRADHVTLLDQVADKALPAVDDALPINLNNLGEIEVALASYGPFDTILALDVLEHLIDPWEVFRHLEAALKPGGTMVVSLPNAAHHSLLIPLACGRFDYADAGILDRTHLRWFTKATMVELCTRGALKLERIEPNIGGRRDQALARLSFGALQRFLASQYRLKLVKPAA